MTTTARNFIDYIEQISDDWLLQELSAGFIGIVLSYTASALSEGMNQAVKAPWLKEPTSPDDVLPLVAAERRLPRYSAETTAAHRDRLWRAWDLYEFGGDESTMLSEFASAGLPNGFIYDIWNNPGAFVDPTYFSQFIVGFPFGSHPITAAGPPWGSFSWGDGTRWGPVGLTLELWGTIKGIIRKWKPVRFICRKVQFNLASGTAEISF